MKTTGEILDILYMFRGSENEQLSSIERDTVMAIERLSRHYGRDGRSVRSTNGEIAQLCGVDISTIKRRIKKCIEIGILKKEAVKNYLIFKIQIHDDDCPEIPRRCNVRRHSEGVQKRANLGVQKRPPKNNIKLKQYINISDLENMDEKILSKIEAERPGIDAKSVCSQMIKWLKVVRKSQQQIVSWSAIYKFTHQVADQSGVKPNRDSTPIRSASKSLMNPPEPTGCEAFDKLVSRILEKPKGRSIYDNWLSNIKVNQYGERIVLKAPTPFISDYVRKKFGDALPRRTEYVS